MARNNGIHTNILFRREVIAKLYLQGYTVRKIPELLAIHKPPILSRQTGGNLSKSIIAKDLEVLREQWREKSTEFIGEQVAEELATLRLTQHEAWKRGDLDNVLKAHDRIAKLLGTNAPARRELSGPGGGPVEITSFTPEQAADLMRHLIPERAEDDE